MAEKSKMPSMQWYPGDWRKDIAIQSLSFHDRGVWFEMLMLMHDSENRGILILNGHAMSDEMIARAIGLDNQTFNQTLTNLLTIGVAEREPSSGAIMNRRMVRDEKIRKIRQEVGKKGGNPNLLNQNTTTGDKQKSTPSSSSSSSSSKPTPKPPSQVASQENRKLPQVDFESADMSLHNRVLCEKVGIFDMREQGAIQQFFASYLRSTGIPPSEAIEHIACRWKEYQEASPKLSYTSGSAYKFLTSGKWDNSDAWPWKPGEFPPGKKIKRVAAGERP